MNHRRTKREKAFVAIFCAVAVLVTLHLVAPRVMPTFLFHVATPVIRGYDAFTNILGRLLVHFESTRRLAEENDTLFRELVDARERLGALNALQSDLLELQQAYSRGDKQRQILAAVLLAPPLSPYDTFVLDAGAQSGVELGSVVRSTSGIPIARISDVFKDFSRAELFSSPGIETAVRIGSGKAQVRAVGVGNGEFQILMPREFEVSVGDQVIFPELSASMFGIVDRIDFQETDFLQLISLRSPVAISSVRFVLVDAPVGVPNNVNDEEIAP